AITNAYDPSEGSVAQQDREAWELAAAGGSLTTGILYDSLEAPPDAPLTAEAAPEVVRSIRGDSVWLDVDRVVASILDTRNHRAGPGAPGTTRSSRPKNHGPTRPGSGCSPDPTSRSGRTTSSSCSSTGRRRTTRPGWSAAVCRTGTLSRSACGSVRRVPGAATGSCRGARSTCGCEKCSSSIGSSPCGPTRRMQATTWAVTAIGTAC